MNFEWDPLKNEKNLIKHDVDFPYAAAIFLGPVLEKEDTRYQYVEPRICAIGQADGVVLFVVYTWRGLNRRLISARLASRKEKTAYQSYMKE